MVIGAGLSGIAAGRRCLSAGFDVVVVDKGRGVGGRMATRRIAGAVVDHGAQFFTVRTERFAAQVATWEATGLAHVWNHGFGPAPDGYPRYAARAGMASLVKDLARPLDVRTETLAFAVRPDRSGGRRWTVVIDDGSELHADAVVITTPVPQSLALVVTAGIELPDALATTDYDRTIALLAVLDRPPAVPAPGGVHSPGGIVSFVADNSAKGLGTVPSLTVHGAADWSLRSWDLDRDQVRCELEAAAAPWLATARIVESQMKRWRFATPQSIWPEPCWRATADDPSVAPLVLAGDAFAGPRVEGAYLSGCAAGQVVVDALSG